MKSLVMTELKAPLVAEDRETLEPKRGEVVVRLAAAALNRRDYWITQGMYPGIETPVVLGSDGAGIVSQVGDSVDDAWVDREVIINPGVGWGDNVKAQSESFSILGLPTDGTFAQEVVVPATQLHAKPAHLNWGAAAALPLAGVTAYRAVFTQGELSAGETVLISGVGGGVATFALQFALAASARVYVTSSSEEKIKRSIKLGAIAGFNYKEDQWWKHASKAGVSPDLIIDGAGGEGYAALTNLAAEGGRIVNYGATAGPPKSLDLFKVFWKQLRLQGSTMGSPSDFANMLAFVEKHQIQPIVDATMPLESVNEALTAMKSSSQFGKLVLTID